MHVWMMYLSVSTSVQDRYKTIKRKNEMNINICGRLANGKETVLF